MEVTGGKAGMMYLCERKKALGTRSYEATRNGVAAQGLGQTRMLQETGGAETADRIGYRNWLTFKDPTCHRNAQCRVTEMPQFHRPFPTPERKLGDRFVRRCHSNYLWDVLKNSPRKCQPMTRRY